MRSDLERDPLEWGIRAYGRGEREMARGLFRLAIRRDPGNEQAWNWMAEVAETPYERAYFLRWVLELNPQNTLAAQKLADLDASGIDAIEVGLPE